MSASLRLFVLYLHLSSVYLDHLVPLEAVNHGKEGKKGGIYFIKGGMSFIGIIGMNSRYEAEIQIRTQPLDARFQGRIITTSGMD